MQLLIQRLQNKEAEIAQYLAVIEEQAKQISTFKEENEKCTKKENQQKKENAND